MAAIENSDRVATPVHPEFENASLIFLTTFFTSAPFQE